MVKWTDSGIRGIIKNEKYKGDLLLQKTITTEPISKRRIENFGEEEQYYVHDHHEPIVSREVWEQAKEIRLSRNRQTDKKADGKREKYTKKYALSSMCECGFCGTKLTRRTLHSSMKRRYGIAEMLLTRVRQTVLTVSRCMNPFWKMLFLKPTSCWQGALMM